MKYKDKTKDELIKELKELKKVHKLLLTSFQKGIKDKTQQIESLFLESKDDFRALLYNSFQGILLLQDNKITFANPAVFKILGLKHEEIYTLHINRYLKLIHPNDFKEALKRQKKFTAGQVFEEEHNLRIKHKNGKYIWVNSSSKSIVIDDKPARLIMLTDITSQKLTEIELREKSNFLDKIIESSALSTWISDKHGTAIRTNPACLKFFGATEKEVIGKYNVFKDSVLIEKGFMPEIKKVFSKGKVANIIIDYDFASVDHVIVKDATHKIINSIFTPVLNDKGKVIYVIVQTIDLTEIKKAEYEAIKEKNKAQQYLEIAGVILVSVNPAGDVQLINPKGCEILEYEKEEILGKNWINNFLPISVRDKVKKVAEKIYSGEIESFKYYENTILTKSGKEKLIAWNNSTLKDSSGRITGILSSGEDITERKKSADELLQSEKKFKMLVTNTEEIIYVIDINGNFTLSEGKGLKKLGLKPGQVVGANVFEFYKDFPEILIGIRKALNGTTSNMDVKVGPNYFRSWNTPQLNINGDVVGIIGLAINITDRKKMEIELMKAKERAEESDRIKTAFLQNMSHEIRTPLNSIMGFASLLPEEEDKKLIKNYSNIIYKNADQLVHIIDDIVLYSQLQNKQFTFFPKIFNATKLLKEIKQSFSIPEYQNGVELEIDIAQNETILICSDYEKIRQVYTNLISNAFKYTPQGTITFGINILENEQHFFVKDTGIGIPHDEIDKIFTRFYRASNVNKSSINGTGLGLSIVKELIDLIGGKIWVKSTPEQGSTFYFTLPYN